MCVCVCVTHAAEESDVVERRVWVDELKRKQLDDQHVVVLRLCSMILYRYTHIHRPTQTYARIHTDRQQPSHAYNIHNLTTSIVIIIILIVSTTRCSAIAERPRCIVRYSFGQKWKTGTGRQYLRKLRSIFNHCDIIGIKIHQIWWKSKIRAITAFKVIEVGTNRKPVCDLLLVINSNWHPISYRFRVIAAYCSNFGQRAFMSPHLWGLGTTYDVHLKLIGKRVVDILLMLIELFR